MLCRIMAQRLIFTLPLAVASIYGQQASPPEQQLAFQPYHASGMYETGDTVGWIVTPGHVRFSKRIEGTVPLAY